MKHRSGSVLLESKLFGAHVDARIVFNNKTVGMDLHFVLPAIQIGGGTMTVAKGAALTFLRQPAR